MAKRAQKPAPPPARPVVHDPRFDHSLGQYENGLKAMYRQKWSEAAKLFSRVAESDDGDLAGRARQLLLTCRDKQASDERPEDPFLLAVVRKNNGELDEALQICSRGGRQSKDERYAYLAASVHALKGEGEAAARFLELAISLNPKNRVHAFHDADFASLRGDAAFPACSG